MSIILPYRTLSASPSPISYHPFSSFSSSKFIATRPLSCKVSSLIPAYAISCVYYPTSLSLRVMDR
eukprot:12893817-Prorocentrum_lima.AAC.1